MKTPRLPDWEGLGNDDSEPWPAALSPEEARIMPLTWDRGDDRIFATYERATRDAYSLADLDYSRLEPSDLSPEERIGLAYWFAMHGTFETAGVLTFARALIASYEEREFDEIRRMLVSVTRDENHHDEAAMRICRLLVPGFPHAFEPSTDLERAAMRNLAWVQSSVNRYWTGYRGAYDRYRFQSILSAFAAGEAAGTFIFGQLAQDSSQPVVREVMRLIARDESRHFSLASHLMRRYLPEMTDDEHTAVARNLLASYAYFSVLLDEPNPTFWSELPASWLPRHQELEDLARKGGLALPDTDRRRDQWRQAMLRVKAITDENDVDFPAIPELGIDGTEFPPLSAEDVMVIVL